MLALAFWAACLGLLIGALAGKEDQVIVLCLVAMFLFSIYIEQPCQVWLRALMAQRKAAHG